MRNSLLALILVAVHWISVGCSSSGEDRTTAPVLPPAKKSVLGAGGTIAKPQVNPNLLLKRRVLNLLHQDKFTELDALLESFQRDFEKDFRKEMILEEAFGAFSAYDPAMESRLHKWVQQFPQSYSAFLARASYFLSRAWASRGSGWAKDTSAAQFEHMELNLNKASQDVTSALKLKGDLIIGFDILISIERLAPTSGSDRPLVERALANWPNSFLIRKAYLYSLRPRWGGSYDEMQAFADAASTYAHANPRLKFLQGFIYLDQGELLSLDKHFEQAVQAHTKALSFGDYWRFRNERAATYWQMKRYAEALEDVNRAMALYPQSEENYVLRSKILFDVERFAEGITDMLTAREIWPYGDEVQEWIRGAAIHLVDNGYQLYKRNEYAQALERFNLAAECDPRYFEIYYWRGTLLVRQGNLSQAQQDLERSVQLNPRHFESYRSLDWVLAKQGKWDAVVEHWNRFLALEPNHAKAYLERGGTFYHKGDLKRAFQDAQKACQLGEQEACARSESIKQRI
jgi:tetratricopeptide (TPR) repeat protein